jgi:transposase-like protein
MNSPLLFAPRGAKARGMARRHSPRHPLFRQRWFADDIIITYGGISLSRTREVTAAKAFFRKAFKRHGEPRE